MQGLFTFVYTGAVLFKVSSFKGGGWMVRGSCLASHNDLSNLAYIAEAMRSRLLRAAMVIGALLIDNFVASCMYLGTALGPLAWEGQLGEK